MKVLAPLTVTESMLISSTIPETDHAAYAAGTTYAAGARVIYQHRIYESLQSSNTGKTPGASTSTAWWLDVGPTGRWAMFDGIVDTASTAASSITVVLQPGVRFDSLGIIAGIGSRVRVRMLDGATVVYDQTKRLASTSIRSMSAYFFAAETLAGELVFENLPRYLNGTVEVTITGSGTVAIGVLAIGTLHDIGVTEKGASASRTSYSRKDTNDFGVTTLLQRPSAKLASLKLILPRSDTRRVDQLFKTLDAVPCICIGSEDTIDFGPLVIFGWLGEFRILYEYAVYAVCNVDFKGLT